MFRFAGVPFRGPALLLLVVLLGLDVSSTWAAYPAPPPPKEYKVHLRYRIRARRNERLAQFFVLIRYLESIGFRKDPGPATEPEDPDQMHMTGTIAAEQARNLLRDPHVRSLVLIPSGYELPADAEAPVKVQIELGGGLPLDRQYQLADQVRARLGNVGFRDMAGYDNRGYTRLVGTIPARNLDLLLEDLRWHGSGWLAPQVPVGDLPAPLRNVWPVRVMEVIPEPDGVPPAREAPTPPAIAQGQEHLYKITPDLRALAAQQDQAAKVARLEVILATAPRTDDTSWEGALAAAAPGLVVEGRVGPLLTVLASPDQTSALAALPLVSTVRLPRPAVAPAPVSGEGKEANQQILEASGLDRLHKLKQRGRGVRVAVIDGDFDGYKQYVGKQLPAGTRLVDLTAERNFNLLPEQLVGDVPDVGRGTRCALAVALAAPEAELTLVRIDPAALHQLQEVARYINGETFRSESLDRRSRELAEETDRLRKERDALLVERRALLDNFGQDPATVQRREAYFKKQRDLDQKEAAHRQREARYLQLQRDLQGLKGIRVAASGLVWNEGYPTDGSSSLSRYFDDRPFRAALWFQAAGNTRGQTWAGLFRDLEGDGLMEFAAPGTPLRQERWTPELNFLAWKPFQGAQSPDLPAKTTVRIAIQWREPHDPEFQRRGEDLYRAPLANLQLLVFRQRDPAGEKLPADDMEVVARSFGLPQRLENQPTSATYEQTVEFTVDVPGRYALQVFRDGPMPEGIRPATVPSLPALHQTWELRPRIYLNTLDEAARARGRVVFLDYPTDQGGIGMPGDARSVISVGAANLAGQLRPYSAGGPVQNLELLVKPDVLAYDGLHLVNEAGPAVYGTGVAAAFAAGTAASALSAGASSSRLFPALHVQPGRVLRIPPQVSYR